MRVLAVSCAFSSPTRASAARKRASAVSRLWRSSANLALLIGIGRALREGVAIEHLAPMHGDHYRLLVENRGHVPSVAGPDQAASVRAAERGNEGTREID